MPVPAAVVDVGVVMNGLSYLHLTLELCWSKMTSCVPRCDPGFLPASTWHQGYNVLKCQSVEEQRVEQ